MVVQFKTMNEQKRANAQINADITAAIESTPTPEQTQASADATAEAVDFVKNIFASIRTFSVANLEQTDAIEQMVQEVLCSAVINPFQKYEKDTPIMCYNGTAFATLRNFSVVIGLPKSRKTWFSQMVAGYFLAAQLGNKYDDNLAGEKINDGDASVLIIDTEQGDYRAAKMQSTIAAIAGLSTEQVGKYLTTLSMRKFGSDISFIATVAKMIMQRPSLVIIDGIADLVTNPNDPAQSAIIYQFLLQASAKYNCHIMVVIHANHSALNKDKDDAMSRGRGHLGSDLERKSEANIGLEKPESDSTITNVTFKSTRDKTPENFAFRIDGNGMPRPCDFVAVTSKQERENEKIAQVVQVMKSKQVSLWAACDLKQELTALSISESTAKRLMKLALDAGLIEKIGSGKNVFYRIKNDQ